MKIAIPTNSGKLCQHFGHCEVFTFINIDDSTKEILNKEEITPPEHVPGIIPPWVAEQGAHLVLAGGMGGRAIELFAQNGVEVITGCPSIEPEQIVKAYLKNSLELGENGCDHNHCE